MKQKMRRPVVMCIGGGGSVCNDVFIERNRPTVNNGKNQIYSLGGGVLHVS